MLDEIRKQAYDAADELCHIAKLQPGELLAVGCSSSEIAGEHIGTHSNQEIARAVFSAIAEATAPRGVLLAAQCCEHLNRALIVELSTAKQFGLAPVNVVPQPKAGGAFATAAYQAFAAPTAVETLQNLAAAGLDIGATLIGMHLRPVAVPVRLHTSHIGHAILIAARTRPKFIGGCRAVYNENLL